MHRSWRDLALNHQGRDSILLPSHAASPYMPFEVVLPCEYKIRSSALRIRAGKSRLVRFSPPMHTLLVSFEILFQVERDPVALLTCETTNVFAIGVAPAHRKLAR